MGVVTDANSLKPPPEQPAVMIVVDPTGDRYQYFSNGLTLAEELFWLTQALAARTALLKEVAEKSKPRPRIVPATGGRS